MIEEKVNSKVKIPTGNATNATRKDAQIPATKCIESMTDEEIIKQNLKELMDKKNREERKANGRLVAVILASLVIFVAIYYAWIRKSGLLAGVLIPAVIMLSFGGWVVVLAKRDKARRALFEKYVEEMAEKNKAELEAKAKAKHSKKTNADRTQTNGTTTMVYINELGKEKSSMSDGSSRAGEHRKHRKDRQAVGAAAGAISRHNVALHGAAKDLRIKRPSIRQKLFHQAGSEGSKGKEGILYKAPTLAHAVLTAPIQCSQLPTLETKRKRLQRMDALPVPTVVRMSSAP